MTILLSDEKGKNYFTIMYDGNETNVEVFHLTNGLNRLVLGKKFNAEEKICHRIDIIKWTEFTHGSTSFLGIELSGKASLGNTPPKGKYLIEFYGDSVTCGMRALDESRTNNADVSMADHFSSYAAQTARHFAADHISISRSGIGVMISWYPQIMPELFNRCNPNKSESKWDFKMKPDAVIVNLGQNDYWLLAQPGGKQYRETFGERKIEPTDIVGAYVNFFKTLCDLYPRVPLICAIGNMNASDEESPFPGYIQEAVSIVRN